MRYKHGAEFLEVQIEDHKLKLFPQKQVKPTVKAKKRKLLTIDEITSMLMPKVEPEASASSSSNEQVELQPEISILRKAIKM
jgi:hypothetical protein